MAKYIPKQTYIGIRQCTRTDTVPLAFLTPFGTDSAAKKRMGTVDNWTGEDGSKETLDNEPMSGFKISDSVRRWSTQNVVWRIEDPRGFELEISSGNMAYVIANTTIESGEILGDMQWCRDGATNYLLPVDTDEYQKYVKFTEAVPIKAKDLKVGNIVVHGGLEYKYLGRFEIAMFDNYYHHHNHINDPLITKVRRHFFESMGDTSHVTDWVGVPKTMALVSNVTCDTDYSSHIRKHKGRHWATTNGSPGGLVIECATKLNIDEVVNRIEIVEGTINESYYQKYMRILVDGSKMYDVVNKRNNGHDDETDCISERILPDIENNKCNVQQHPKRHRSPYGGWPVRNNARLDDDIWVAGQKFVFRYSNGDFTVDVV